ncbi:gypsy type transposase [Tanacetum coccineum]|uniref:Gypsy type transposase n=1 Tax=Tanacetum coccineum TaxID=301880 RepID=A0ABQ4ZTZ8_9ASTR
MVALLGSFESARTHVIAMMDLRQRILPLSYLTENHRDILQSDFVRGIQQSFMEELSSSIDQEDTESDLMCLESDIAEIESRPDDSIQANHPTLKQLAELTCACKTHIGTQSGGMDQATSIIAKTGFAELIDFNPIRATDVQLPAGGECHVGQEARTKKQAEMNVAKVAYTALIKGIGRVEVNDYVNELSDLEVGSSTQPASPKMLPFRTHYPGLVTLKAFIFDKFVIKALHGQEGGLDHQGYNFNGTWSRIVGSSNFLHSKDDTCIWSMVDDGVFSVRSIHRVIDSKLLPFMLPATTWDKTLPRKLKRSGRLFVSGVIFFFLHLRLMMSGKSGFVRGMLLKRNLIVYTLSSQLLFGGRGDIVTTSLFVLNRCRLFDNIRSSSYSWLSYRGSMTSNWLEWAEKSFVAREFVTSTSWRTRWRTSWRTSWKTSLRTSNWRAISWRTSNWRTDGWRTGGWRTIIYGPYCAHVDGALVFRVNSPGAPSSKFTFRLADRITENSVLIVSLGRVPRLDRSGIVIKKHVLNFLLTINHFEEVDNLVPRSVSNLVVHIIGTHADHLGDVVTKLEIELNFVEADLDKGMVDTNNVDASMVDAAKVKAQVRNKRTWTAEEDQKLIEALMAVQNLLDISILNPGLKADPHIKSRLKTWRTKFSIMHDMVFGSNTSGFGWDTEKCVLTAPDDVWDSYLKNLDSVKNWNDHFFWVDEFVVPANARFKMDLNAFIRTADPRKVRIIERARAENERPIVTVAKHRTVTLLPTSVVRSSGEFSASVEREFVGDASVGDGGDQGFDSVGGQDNAKPTVPVETEVPIPKRSKKKRVTRGSERMLLQDSRLSVEQGVPALPTLPFITSTVTPSPLEDGGDRTDSALNLGHLKLFLLVSLLLRFMNEASTVATLLPKSIGLFLLDVSKERVNAAFPSIFVLGSEKSNFPEVAATKVFELNDEAFCANRLITSLLLLSLKLLSQESSMSRLFTEFNVSDRTSLAEEKDILLEAKDKEIEDLKSQLLKANEESVEVAQLRVQVSGLEATENSLRGEVASTKEHNVLLEQECDSLKLKVTSLESTIAEKDHELSDLGASSSSLKSQNQSLVNQVHELEISSADLREKLEMYEGSLKQLEEFQDNLMGPLKTRWLLTHGMKLLLVKCLNSTEYMEALGHAFGRAIEKGMQEGLAAGIEHGQAGRCLTDLEAYIPSAEADFNSAIRDLRDLNFPLLQELSNKKDASTWDIMDLLRLDDVVAETLALSVALDICRGWVEKIERNLIERLPFLKDVFVYIDDPLSVEALIEPPEDYDNPISDVFRRSYPGSACEEKIDASARGDLTFSQLDDEARDVVL